MPKLLLSLLLGLLFHSGVVDGSQGSESSHRVTGTTLNSRLEVFESHEQAPLEGLLSLAKKIALPMGIIVADDDLLQVSESFVIRDSTVSEIIARILKPAKGYGARAIEGVLLISKEGGSVGNDVLRVQFQSFDTHIPMNATQISETLWGYLQITLDPKRTGFGGVLRIPPGDQILKRPLKLQNVTIQNVLNALVLEEGDMSWIAWPPPEVLRGAPQYRLWNLVLYPRDQPAASKMCCIYIPTEMTKVPVNVRDRLDTAR